MKSFVTICVVLIAFAAFSTTRRVHLHENQLFYHNVPNKAVAIQCARALKPNITEIRIYQKSCSEELNLGLLRQGPHIGPDFKLCMAERFGIANDARTGINSTRLREVLTAQVTGSEVQSFAEAGITNCPDVQEFHINHFIQCVKQYCKNNGTLPTN